MDKDVEHRLESLLGGGDGPRPQRLVADARRLWGRTRRLLAMDLAPPPLDAQAMELACCAFQLPLASVKGLQPGRLGQVSLRERAEQAAELLITHLAGHVDEALLDRASALLRDLPRRKPLAAEAQLLADAINLEDFGLTGLFGQASQLARQAAGLEQIAEGFHKRQQYGYWDARLKDGFHFEPVRQMARRRLANALRCAQMLLDELGEDS